MFRVIIQFIFWGCLILLVSLGLADLVRRLFLGLLSGHWGHEEELKAEYQVGYGQGYTAGYNQAVLESEEGPIKLRYEKPYVREVPGSWSD